MNSVNLAMAELTQLIYGLLGFSWLLLFFLKENFLFDFGLYFIYNAQWDDENEEN